MDAKYRLFKGGQTVVDLVSVFGIAYTETELMNIGIRAGELVTGTPSSTPVHSITHSSQVAVERTRPHGRTIGIDLIPAQPPRGVATFQGDFLSPSVQEMVKNYISESSKRQPPPVQEEDDDEGEEIDRPSYIDRERHDASPETGKQGGKSVDAAKGRLVDVCRTLRSRSEIGELIAD